MELPVEEYTEQEKKDRAGFGATCWSAWQGHPLRQWNLSYPNGGGI